MMKKKFKMIGRIFKLMKRKFKMIC